MYLSLPQWLLRVPVSLNVCQFWILFFSSHYQSIGRILYLLVSLFYLFSILVFNKLQKKTHTVIWIPSGETFDKIKHLFNVKTLSKLGIDVFFTNQIKGIFFFKPMANIIVNGERATVFPLKSRTRQGYLLSLLLLVLYYRSWPVQ